MYTTTSIEKWCVFINIYNPHGDDRRWLLENCLLRIIKLIIDFILWDKREYPAMAWYSEYMAFVDSIHSGWICVFMTKQCSNKISPGFGISIFLTCFKIQQSVYSFVTAAKTSHCCNIAEMGTNGKQRWCFVVFMEQKNLVCCFFLKATRRGMVRDKSFPQVTIFIWSKYCITYSIDIKFLTRIRQ